MSLEITILGCGTSSGVPIPGIGWGNCNPNNPKNYRKRVAILVKSGDTQLLVDAGPDLREQLLASNINHLDGLFITHAHADHIHGLDDLRWINNKMKRDLPCFTDAKTLAILQERFAYVFTQLPVGQENYHKPVLTPQIIGAGKKFTLHHLECLSLEQNHGFSKSFGLRIENFAYCTDVFDFPSKSWQALQGIDCWVVDCLGYKPHPTHAHLERVLGWVEQLKPKQTYFTHMNASLDYDEVMKILPQGVQPAYDGLVINV